MKTNGYSPSSFCLFGLLNLFFSNSANSYEGCPENSILKSIHVLNSTEML